MSGAVDSDGSGPEAGQAAGCRSQPASDPEARPAVTVVVPTYNEADNLATLLERIDRALSATSSYEVLIVDDDSPDETWRVGERLAEDYPVRVIRRTEESGLSTAVIRGFSAARAEHIVVMDADLQHPPERLPDLIEALEGGPDMAVGSRHAEHGSMGAFGPFRRLVSWVADALARTLLPDVRGVSDLQSGFFALHRSVVDEADLDPIGYKILLEVLVHGDADEVVEVGYTFGERHAGESKLDAGNVLAYLRHLVRLIHRSGESMRVLQFVVVGGLGALVNLATMYSLMQLGSPYLLASPIAIEAGLVSNFTLNRLWTFEDRAPDGLEGLAGALGRDHVVRSGGMAVNFGLLWVLVAVAGLLPLVGQAIGIAGATAWNFMGNTWWTWRTGR
ncbi:dolichol monophosphate mannose synthase [Thermoplasmatales archaeon SW_10_69_26]|nr:MAG: dolichol monophosphate mannose synthase [Thermoplasmatales archaeon SW_10_69_26]